MRNLQGAVWVLDQLKQKGSQMKALIYNCLVDASVQWGDTVAAQISEITIVDTHQIFAFSLVAFDNPCGFDTSSRSSGDTQNSHSE